MKHISYSLVFAMLAWTLVLACGCSDTDKPPDAASVKPAKLPAIEVLSSSQEQQKERAIEAKDKLFASLLSELMKSMGENGPAKSIKVCKTRAPELAAQISQETGVQIGRTSFKLRNDANQPPDWAAAYVEDKAEEAVHIALPNDELGILLPIRLQATCTLCHGSDDQIMPEVKAAIVSNYPNDTATGFAEGEIRGYFWIEVPAN